jgi:tRNA threonylcarbamoyladenosine biosynthesis protein TsaB
VIILTLRTDKPEAEIGLYENNKQLIYESWQAHRELTETIHKKFEEILNKSSKSVEDLEGIVCFKGPGSFTGLRIGAAVANALAYAQSIPIIAKSDPNWCENGVKDLLNGQNNKIAIPEYGSEAIVTKQKK